MQRGGRGISHKWGKKRRVLCISNNEQIQTRNSSSLTLLSCREAFSSHRWWHPSFAAGVHNNVVMKWVVCVSQHCLIVVLALQLTVFVKSCYAVENWQPLINNNPSTRNSNIRISFSNNLKLHHKSREFVFSHCVKAICFQILVYAIKRFQLAFYPLRWCIPLQANLRIPCEN